MSTRGTGNAVDVEALRGRWDLENFRPLDQRLDYVENFIRGQGTWLERNRKAG